MNDTVITNARMWTGDRLRPYASTAVVREGRFVFVGEARDVNAEPGAKIVDLKGRFMMPGFTDAHVHLLWTGFAMESIDLKSVRSIDEAVRRVNHRARATPVGSWVTGAGWDQNLWLNQAFPHRRALDAATLEHPVQLTHTSGHCTWVNSAALRAAGVTRHTMSPVGGSIDVDAEGEPTGILRDNASKLVTDAMPHPTQADRIATLETAISQAHRLGVTSVHAMNVGRGEFQALHALNDSGKLRLRTTMFMSHEKLAEWIERNMTTGDGDDMLRVGGVKFFADGALGSLTAWMFEPYADTEDYGFPLQAAEDLERDVRRALEHGLAPAVHAIGDRANHEVLDMYERARVVAPELPRRIEHAQLLSAADIPRFADLGVMVSAQPIHATADWQKVDREWGSRGDGAYAFASLRDSGTNIAFGSDTPVETMDPIAGVHAAVTRKTADGEPRDGWYPLECISVDDALRFYTAGPAVSVGDVRSGRIAAGCHADYVVLSQNPFAIESPMDLLEIQILETTVAGEVVYSDLR